MTTDTRVSIALHAVYDADEESVGISISPSPAFEAGHDTRAMIESLAAITAKANHLAADVIAHWDAPDDRKKELIEHFAFLKENMLSDMLQQSDASGADA